MPRQIQHRSDRVVATFAECYSHSIPRSPFRGDYTVSSGRTTRS
jgi:hypothetical protein